MFFKPNYKRRGFLLYIVCALAIGLFILIAGFSKFKSGAVLQLSKTVTQEKMIIVAQAAVNESLAAIKADINKSSSAIGSKVKDFWKNKKAAPSQILNLKYTGSNLKASAEMAKEYLDTKGSVSTEVSLYATDKIEAQGVTSYIGFLKIVGKVSCEGVKDAVTITEQHDLKLTDLSYPFLDKYAFFLKSYNAKLNDVNGNFVINGVKGLKCASNTAYSFVYFGNRNYPNNKEYTSGKNPPVLLDLDFKKDKKLLGSFYKDNAEFSTVDPELKRVSKGKFFYTFTKKFTDYRDSFVTSDFAKVKELELQYLSLIQTCKKNYSNDMGIAHMILNDFNRAGGVPAKSEVFAGILHDAFPVWKYMYGYTDYNHVTSKEISGTYPFDGMNTYFSEYKQTNVAKLLGGSMPAIFGENRDIPVYVDGPVYVRFFKVAFIDEVTVEFNIGNLSGGSDLTFPIGFPQVTCRWEKPGESYSSKDVSRIDAMTKQFMSHPIDFLSINNFYFGAGENVANKPNTLTGTKMKGYDAFHYLDPQMRTVSSYYDTAEDFRKERIKNINGEDVLDLDGISVIFGKDNNKLDLSDIKKYRGKGMVIFFRGNCVLGNLAACDHTAKLLPVGSEDSYLKIWLMGGRFFINEGLDSATIQASLISMVRHSDNSSCPSNQEGGLITNKVTTHIVGNLLVDSFFNDMEDKKNLKVTHDAKIYNCSYPVRVSIGAPKSLYILDYKGKD